MRVSRRNAKDATEPKSSWVKCAGWVNSSHSHLSLALRRDAKVHIFHRSFDFFSLLCPALNCIPTRDLFFMLSHTVHSWKGAIGTLVSGE